MSASIEPLTYPDGTPAQEGDEVLMPAYPRGTIRGILVLVDQPVTVRDQRYDRSWVLDVDGARHSVSKKIRRAPKGVP